MIDNQTAQSMYIEKYSTQTITILPEMNSQGKLERDDKNNNLSGLVDLGKAQLQSLDNYPYSYSLLLYNENGEFQLVNQNEKISLSLDWDNYTNYKINARKIYSDVYDDITNTFTLNIPESESFGVYLIFLNNKPIKSFRIDNNKIKITDGNLKYIDKIYNRLDLIIFGDQTLRNTPITISYLGVSLIYDYNKFINEEYFPNEPHVEEMILYDAPTYSESITKASIKEDFDYRGKTYVNDMSATLDMTFMIDNTHYDLYNQYKGSIFRVIIVNPLVDKIDIYNNCYISDGITFEYNKTTNNRRVVVDVDNRIEILVPSVKPYGKELYNEGYYNGETIIINSKKVK